MSIWDRRPKNCNLVKDSGIAPRTYCGLCNGLYQFSKIELTDSGLIRHYETYCDCEKCHRFLFTRNKKMIGWIAIMILSIVSIWVMGTPQGTIRRNLLMTGGLHAAVSATITKCEVNEDSQSENAYTVTLDGEDERWQLWTLQYVFYSSPKY